MPSLSARELRAHFRPRTPSLYFAVAVRAARSTAAQLATQTHWNVYDTPIYRSTQRAACGAIVGLQRFSADPTCPACREQQARYEAIEV